MENALTKICAKKIFNLMKADVLLGLQWGDEGQGKIVDVIESVNLDDKKWFTKKKLC